MVLNNNNDDSENKFVFLNPIFVDKIDYLDLKENIITYLFIIIFIILIILTLYYFFYDELLIVYYFLIKKDYVLNELETELINDKLNEFKNYFLEQNYQCFLNTLTYKYNINTKDNILLEDVNGNTLTFDNLNDCKTLLDTVLNKDEIN